MNTRDLLAELSSRNIRVSVVDDRLRVDAPKDALTPVLKEAIAERKAELIERLFWTTDPRPDLTEDADLWARLLSLAYDFDGTDRDGLFGVLHGCRCDGVKLIMQDDVVRMLAGELGDAYPEVREKWLKPWAGWLNNLLIQLAQDRWLHPGTESSAPDAITPNAS